jgi:hypothetical protein
MTSMAYTTLALKHGAIPGAGVAPCWPQEQFSARTNDAANGV